MRNLATFMVAATAAGLLAAAGTPAQAVTDCIFTTVGMTDFLDADCTTDETIFVPDGVTLDGRGNAITAVDPPAGHFLGGVVENAGTVAHVTRLVVNTGNLANACDAGADRLRGIMFEGASGSITHTTVESINQGASGCQEGNAIEVRNAPFVGVLLGCVVTLTENCHPDTQTVEIAHNVLQDWQKSGIVCNGDVDCHIHHNMIGESFTQNNLAANSVQIGFGAFGMVELNHIAGNQWKGTTPWAATAVLLYQNDISTIRRNNIGGNSDIGIYAYGLGGDTIDNNRVFDGGADHANSGWDIGIGDWGPSSSVTNNKIRGFDTPVDGNVDPETQKLIPSPNVPPEVCFGADCDNL